MGSRLPAFASVPQHTVSVVLSGATYRLRWTWRERLSAWYLDLYDADGVVLIYGRRVSPGWGPFFDQPAVGAPVETIVVSGVDGYDRDHLPETLEVVAWLEAELLSVAPDDPVDDLIVTAV